MRLRHIEVFHAVMQEGSLTAAAQFLFVTQPAVSKLLQQCELHLGLTLFARVKGRLHPTPDAVKLFAEVERLHGNLLAVRRFASALKGRSSEVLRVAATPALASAVLPGALVRWREGYASTRCQLASHHTKELVSALLLGECDVALSLQDPQHPRIVAERLASGPMCALAPLALWPAALRGVPCTAADLPSNLMALPDDDPLGARVMAALASSGCVFQSHTQVQTYPLARQLVESGVGVALVDPFTASMADPLRTTWRPLAPTVDVPLYQLGAVHASNKSRAVLAAVAAAQAEALHRLAPMRILLASDVSPHPPMADAATPLRPARRPCFASR